MDIIYASGSAALESLLITDSLILLSAHVPERGEDAVSHKDAKAINQRQPQADVLEVVVGASE